MKTVLTLIVLLTGLTLAAQEKGVIPLSLSTAGNGTQSTGTTYAVVVGISDYQNEGIPDLKYAHKDAEAFANFLRSPAGGSLDGDHLKVLLNSEATMAQFAAALDWLWEESKEGDQAIIYFSGHGDVEKKSLTQPGFLLCWDAPARVYMGGGAFALPMLQEVISTLSIQNKAKVVVITDACRSGTLAGQSVGGAQATAANLAKQYANEIKILSCQPNEYSIEGEQWGGGRGAFSFNLVDALYGLADGNNDLFVTLQEVGRYLEDHVTAEVAPVSQVPMVLGNRTERLASVDAKLLANLRSGRTNQLIMLSPVESRGIEEDVLAGVDASLRELYQLFKNALKEKQLLEPAEACAETYYKRLITEPKMQRLHSTMTRNYAAALQDDAQQAMNIWLAADVQQLQCIGKSLRIEPIPRQLARAAELLGEGHYIYRSMQARRLLFEGILEMKHENPDEALGRKCLALFRQSLELEAQSALPWHRMSLVYANNLRMPDSAFVCARQARNLAPNWVLPFTDLAYTLSPQNKLDLAKQVLEEAEAIDPLHPYVINGWATWFNDSDDKANREKAALLFEKYQESGGPLYPCWFNDYGLVLMLMGKYPESEAKFNGALALDSTNVSVWSNLGNLYVITRRFAEAEAALKKAIAIDSTNFVAWNTFGSLYRDTDRFAEAETALKRAIALDSTNTLLWSNFGDFYCDYRLYEKAEVFLRKAIALDSTNSSAWDNLGKVYHHTGRNAEAEVYYLKALSFDSTMVQHWFNLGSFYFSNRRYAEAETALKRAIAIDSTVIFPWILLGGLYLNTRRYTEAEPAFKNALALDSTDAFTWRDLGILYLQTRRFAEAEAALKSAIAFDSTSAGAQRSLGAVYFKTNRPEEARRQFLKTIELQPNALLARVGLAAISYTEGKTADALDYVEQAIAKGITFEQLQSDEDIAPMRVLPAWKELMKKYFPDQVKD